MSVRVVGFFICSVLSILFSFATNALANGEQSLFEAKVFYPLNTAKQDAQFHNLLRELRCLVCQNQDLADSNASLAKDLRDEVYVLVKNGKSDDEIVHYLTARYGDFILFKPPVKVITVLLWFGPALFLVVGVLVFWRTCFLPHRY